MTCRKNKTRITEEKPAYFPLLSTIQKKNKNTQSPESPKNLVDDDKTNYLLSRIGFGGLFMIEISTVNTIAD